jgi:hypothetical protein
MESTNYESFAGTPGHSGHHVATGKGLAFCKHCLGTGDFLSKEQSESMLRDAKRQHMRERMKVWVPLGTIVAIVVVFLLWLTVRALAGMIPLK